MDTMVEKIQFFLQIDDDRNFGYGCGDGSGDVFGYGYGFGYGSADGYADGSCYGYGYDFGDGSGAGFADGAGYADGSGFGRGSADGFADGSGYGSGIKSVCGKEIHDIDGVPTIITSIKGNVARGFIFRNNFVLEKTYVAKSGNYFAHGKTIKEALKEASGKYYANCNYKETIENFIGKFKKEEKYKAGEFFEWHFYLTGSCTQGRKMFMQERGIDFEDMYTVDEFIEITTNGYGGEIIEELKNEWGDVYGKSE